MTLDGVPRAARPLLFLLGATESRTATYETLEWALGVERFRFKQILYAALRHHLVTVQVGVGRGNHSSVSLTPEGVALYLSLFGQSVGQSAPTEGSATHGD